MITSTSNPQVKDLVQLQKKSRLRAERDVFIVEGIRMVQEAPRDRVVKVFVSEAFVTKKKEEWEKLGFPVEKVIQVTDTVFAKISDTKSPQGILCVMKRASVDLDQILNSPKAHILVLDGLQDPGNAGTILRASEAAGVTGILLSSDCVDIYNPKVIRSTMGSIYRMPFVYMNDTLETINTLKEHGVHTYAAHLDGKNSYDQEDYTGKCAFLIGNEGNGLKDEVADMADTWIRIPMAGQVESLNAAIATSILMFEVFRQRRG